MATEAEIYVATPKQLVEKIAEETGVPIGTAILHDRNLLTAGLRSEGQRGRGKSVVTFEDAANLLIAVAGSRNVKDSAETVRLYAPLKATAPLVFNDQGKDIVRGETFGDALAALLEALPADRDSYRDPEHGSVEVTIYGPNPAARIIWKVGERGGTIDYRPPHKRGAKRMFADLEFISKFTQVTIGHVGEMVAAEGSDPRPKN
ncbi:hypothetical protein Nham_0329 [Nitrobacter hamburgensis X14]|uniref:Uncharacterized protein n=1 Tax=Nitrobacter hamburgensis (strain DSM 10229 / NCIMB 13809 / X14) TaxID=323097 RepID=Q1QRC2_NITHX|nr:hypothetical protein [Nitrobacter hamburgensis]ABE61225.1 hypothetical protein Nham_0329 [Nitrobacter hamburgensis X14]